jgi:hypothetical protein
MKIIRATLLVPALALALLGGCMAVPVAPGPYAGSPGYYAPAPAYYAPAPVYYAPPVYYGPSFGIGVYAGRRGHGGRGHGRR